jgi:hypothetical protein
VERRTFLKVSGAVLLTRCTAVQQIGENAPPAQTPVLKSLKSVVPRTCDWTDFTADTDGNFVLLPSGHPSGDIRVVVGAPYPSKMAIDVDGQDFLREPDQNLSPGEGYYRINSINLAENKDTFDWDLTITAPAWRRVEPMLQINIGNVSTNPSYSGTDKTSAPLALPLVRSPVADLEAWLNQNPTVRDAISWEGSNGRAGWSSWTSEQKDFLRRTFAAAWNTSFLLLEDPPRNIATPGDTDAPLTVITETDAWLLYVAYISYNLAVEIAGWTSWSLTTYPQDQLEQLLDSRQMYRWNNANQGFDVCEGQASENVVPASPWTTLLFLYENGIYTCRSRADVIARMVEWCRQNLAHFSGGFEAKNMEDQWQYRGCPPVFRIIRGTAFPGAEVESFRAVLHRTAGCWGTTSFLKATLRVLNIPVKEVVIQSGIVRHSLPSFVSEGLYMTHGDDPYSRLTKCTPPYPSRELLIDQAKFDQWFGSNVPAAEQLKNVGRQVQELAIEHLPDSLLRAHCRDQAANVANADSEVYDSFKNRFTVAELEAQNLWTRLDDKIRSLGGCSQIP